LNPRQNTATLKQKYQQFNYKTIERQQGRAINSKTNVSTV